MRKDPLYTTWVAMIQRCHNPKNESWPRYGARGISVCDGWRESFATFRSDVGDRPLGHTLDRINNDGAYEPGNVRWASAKEQQNNTRRTQWVLFRCRKLTVAHFAKEAGLSYKAVVRRLEKGWSPEKIATTPPHRGKR